MGCVSSKNASPQSLASDDVPSSSARARRSNRSGRSSSSLSLHVKAAFGPSQKVKEEPEREAEAEAENEESGKKTHDFGDYLENLKAVKNGAPPRKKAVFGATFGRMAEGEQVAAGWPAWLSAAAGEAIEGWLPLRSNAFERLDKIGQGTYSSVYRARDLKTGKMVAVKKVRFDSFQRESVRFMAREILILRKLDHPNVMKLEGIITSHLSCSLCLVFEYMEHDLSGLLSCPDVRFTDSQIKCYMRQLLSAAEHCHSRGIMHRDIKSSNILVSNEGILKIADFGLANFLGPKNKELLTSRVVTLWYRPPELLLGSTSYGEAVDLWSIGCVFGELFIGRPLLKGRTEVEQLHKIFRLCGTPPDDYWKRCRLPLAAMFKPQCPYESTLRERCKEFPRSAVKLMETFLSIEPYKRGTAASALNSEYFKTKPYACEPTSLPKYPPNKEIDAKIREEAKRKNGSAVAKAEANPRRAPRTSTIVEADFQAPRRNHGRSRNAYRRRGGIEPWTSLNQSSDAKSEASQMTQESQGLSTNSIPVQLTASSGFAWAKRQKQRDAFTRLNSQPASTCQKANSMDTSSVLLEPDRQEDDDTSSRIHRVEAAMPAVLKEQAHLPWPDSFGSSDIFESQELSTGYGHRKKGRVGFSGPLTYQSQEKASRHYGQPHQRSRFHKDIGTPKL